MSKIGGPWGIAILSAVVVIVATLLTIFIPRLLQDRVPQVTNILPSIEIEAGKSIDIQGKNFDLVAEIWLSRGDFLSRPKFSIQDDGDLATVTISEELVAGEYNLRFKTIKGDTISTGRTVTVVHAQELRTAATPTLSSIPEPFSVTITEPSEGTPVLQAFTVKGTTSSPIPEGYSLWIVMEDDDGDHYPLKSTKPLPDGNWGERIQLGLAWENRTSSIIIVQVKGEPNLKEAVGKQEEEDGLRNVFQLGIPVEPLAKRQVRVTGPLPTQTPTPTPIPPAPTPTLDVCLVTIEEPDDGSTVQMQTTVRGTATNMCTGGDSLWVIVEVGGRQWPQLARLTLFPKAGTDDFGWFVTARIGQPGDAGLAFAILVISTTSEIDQEFADWFNAGESSGMYPGFIPRDLISKGAQVLAGIAVTRS